MTDTTGEPALNALVTLAEPMRRDLYAYVVRRGGPVSRDEAARALGIARSLAAFHLDRLVDAGLLAAGYRRLSGRTGPGAGRPAKVYRRSDRRFELSLPHRRHELLAELLAGGVDDARSADGQPPGEAVRRRARDVGTGLG
ncbi:MAG: helix-turn-helix domain-containing protein, partial [Chloroflexota bacterium]|nr:helix-turn-helix domain-containing protein [Chloroflexota bacterium]